MATGPAARTAPWTLLPGLLLVAHAGHVRRGARQHRLDAGARRRHGGREESAVGTTTQCPTRPDSLDPGNGRDLHSRTAPTTGSSPGVKGRYKSAALHLCRLGAIGARRLP